jgi:hypothetical protein
MIRFADGGLSVHSKSGHRVSVPSPSLSAFTAIWQMAIVKKASVAPDAEQPAKPEIVADVDMIDASSDDGDHNSPGNP